MSNFFHKIIAGIQALLISFGLFGMPSIPPIVEPPPIEQSTLEVTPRLGAIEKPSKFTAKADRFETPLLSTLPESGESKAEVMKAEPKVVLKKWNGEVALGVKYNGLNVSGAVNKDTDVMEWKGAKQEMHAYPLDAKEGMEDGGFEIEIVLNEKPATNVFCYSIESNQNLNWYKQLPLWKEWGLSAPTGTCNDTECDTDGDGEMDSFRPINVVNSFAVYYGKSNHKIGDLNYSTGKAFHRFRVQAVDINGDRIWGDSIYENGQVCDIISMDWLETAKYPVTL